MYQNYKEQGDALYLEEKYQEAFEQYKLCISTKEIKITPHFNNRILACCRKTKKLDNYLYIYELLSNMDKEIYDLENYTSDDYIKDNVTYLWLLYDLVKEDDFNVNMYLQKVLYCEDSLKNSENSNYKLYLTKLLLKNELVNKELMTRFLGYVNYKEYSKELKNIDGKYIASDYEGLGYQFAKFYNGTGNYEKSNEICDDLLALEPRESKYRNHILNLQSKNFFSLGKEDVALEKKDQAMQVKDDWYLYHEKGLIFLEQNNIKEAGKFLTLALLKNRQQLGFLNKLLQDLKLLYTKINKTNIIEAIDSLLYYSRKMNSWSIKPELELAKRFEVNDDNYRRVYNTFLRDCAQVMTNEFVEDKKEGVITNYNSERRFGFIKDKEGKSYYFSQNSYLGDSRKINTKDKVAFELVERFNQKKNTYEFSCEYVIKL